MVTSRAPMSRVHFHGIAERRQVVNRSPVLQRMADHLYEHLDPLRRGEIYVPEQKALLSCDGGVCPADGSRLMFDPLSPHDHECPACHARYQGDRHHRAWIWRYHLWLSERAVHFALLGALDRDEDGFARAFAIAQPRREPLPRPDRPPSSRHQSGERSRRAWPVRTRRGRVVAARTERGGGGSRRDRNSNRSVRGPRPECSEADHTLSKIPVSGAVVTQRVGETREGGWPGRVWARRTLAWERLTIRPVRKPPLYYSRLVGAVSSCEKTKYARPRRRPMSSACSRDPNGPNTTR